MQFILYFTMIQNINSNGVPILGSTIDKSQVPPIHQKRILAFVNHFIVSTCSFLNEFVVNCESKFIDFERKLQRVEASLVIIESKLSSIPGLEQIKTTVSPVVEVENTTNFQVPQETPIFEDQELEVPTENNPEIVGVKACDDSRYKKYFKMLQFGVPPAAVKMKMQAEGFDGNILNDPNAILADGVEAAEPE